MTLQQPESSKMKYAIHTRHCAQQGVAVKDVTTFGKYFCTWVAQRLLQVGTRAPREVVINANLRSPFHQELLYKMGADKPGTTDDQKAIALNLHP